MYSETEKVCEVVCEEDCEEIWEEVVFVKELVAVEGGEIG